MHRSIDITTPPAATSELLAALHVNEHVIGVSLHAGAGVKPPGDVVSVQVLNRGANEVLRAAARAQEHGAISIVTADLESLIDPQHKKAVARDVDEALWEEAETGLRHQGGLTINFLLLMAFGGAVATAGFLVTPSTRSIAFVAAAIIAPGFEPLAKIPIGVVLRRPSVAWRGARSATVGYLVLGAAAALTFTVLRVTGATEASVFLENSELDVLSHPSGADLVLSVGGAVTGVLMMIANRRSVIAGPLIAIALVPAATMPAMAATLGHGDLVLEGLERLTIDVVLVIVLGSAVVAFKQATFHRRTPIV